MSLSIGCTGNIKREEIEMLIEKIWTKNEKGFVLPVALMLLAILAIIGITAIVFTTMDIQIGKNVQTSVGAFYDAESGVNFGMGCIQNALDGDILTLPEDIDGTVDLSSVCSCPTGFSFTLSDVTKVDENEYSFTSTGNASTGATAKIKASFRKGIAINYAAFGDILVDMKANSKAYCYDSRNFPEGEDEDDLVADDSLDEGSDVGSNHDVRVYNGTTITGDVALGDDDGDPATEAVLTSTGTPVIFGEEGADVPHVNPDPLGILSGEYAIKVSDTAAAGNPQSLGTTISESGLMVLTAGDYYFTDIVLKNGAELRIDCTDGDVNIFLEGGLEAKNQSEINVVNGNASNFGIFSNSTDSLVFKHGSEFKGVIYAPNATVEMKNSAAFYGAIWAETVELKNSAEVWFDTALRDKYQSNEVELSAWLEMFE